MSCLLIFRRALAAFSFATVFIGASSAHAAPITISYSTSFQVSTQAIQTLVNNPGDPTTVPYGVSESNQSAYSLQAFDSSLGTLTGVQVTFEARWNYFAEGRATGNDFVCDPFSGTCTELQSDAQMSGQVTGAYALALIDPTGAERNFSSAQAVNCAAAGLGYQSCIFQRGGSGISNGTLDVSSIPLAQFLADQDDMSIYFQVSNRQTASITACTFNDAQDFCESSTIGGFFGTLSVAYQYESYVTTAGSVPEPGSLGLVLGAGGLGLLARRRRISVNALVQH